MFLLNWLREYKQIKAEYRICESCETLKMELSHLRQDNERLLNAVLSKPIIEETVSKAEDLVPIQPRVVPWRVRQQMLEAEDRDKAKKMRDNPINQNTEIKTNIVPGSQTTTQSISDLEDELGVVVDGN